MTPIPRFPCRYPLLVLAVTALIAGCGGGGDQTDDVHDNTTINTAGRLAIAENGTKALRMHDLDSGSVEAMHQLDNAASALYMSPGGRYVVAMQRLQDQVQFIDGGIWQEDHGDHMHDYKNASRLMNWKLTGSRPTHYDLQYGKQAAIFMDGNASASPAQNAGVRLVTEASIATGNTSATLNLGFPIHGLGEPVDNKLLTVHRAEDAPDDLPTHLDLYLRSGSSYAFQRRLTTRCNRMHGSYSAGAYTAAGCADGVLLARHVSATDVTDQKIATPIRVSTVAGHPKASGQFIAFGNDGLAPAPVTTRFFAIDGENMRMTEVTPTGWGSGRIRRAHAFDRSGTRFYLLDDQGTLVVLQRQGTAWNTVARIPAAIPAMPAEAPWPTITTNGARDEIYVTDPVARQLVVINSQTSAIVARQNLGYVPSYALWMGIAR